MANKIGPLIKEARTNAGLTQEKLAAKIKGLSAADISKAENGELELTQAILKEIAKVTGVTQASLINAAKESTYKKTSSAAAKKPAASSASSVKLTAQEKKLLELFRKADADRKKEVMQLLEEPVDSPVGNLLSGLLSNLTGNSGNSGNSNQNSAANAVNTGNILSGLLGGNVSNFVDAGSILSNLFGTDTSGKK